MGTGVRGAIGTFLGIAVLITGCGPVLKTVAPTSKPAHSPTLAGHLPNAGWLTYHDDNAGFSVEYPLTWARRDSGAYPVVFALQAALGTTLIEKTMEVNVTEGATECKESRYNTGNAAAPPEHARAAGGIDFLRELGGGIAAGNIYDSTSYSTRKGALCLTIAFVLHAASSGVYLTEPAPFDRAAESEVFVQVLDTFRFDP
jgi:hypothetical protein